MVRHCESSENITVKTQPCDITQMFEFLQMLYMIGATSEYANEINGAVVNVRNRGDKICKFYQPNFPFLCSRTNQLRQKKLCFHSGLDSRLSK